MRRALIPLLLLAVVPLGCGGAAGTTMSTKALPAKPGTHGGTAFPLPDEKGYAEIVVEPVKQTKAGREVVLAVYFLTADLKLALPSAPADVFAKMTLPGEEGEKRVNLIATPKSPNDGRFATEVGRFDYDEIRGELAATIGGSPITVPFAIR